MNLDEVPNNERWVVGTSQSPAGAKPTTLPALDGWDAAISSAIHPPSEFPAMCA